MIIQDAILEVANQKHAFKTTDVHLFVKGRVTKEYISSLITKMVMQGILVKSGTTAKATYALPQNIDDLGHIMRQRLLREHVKEHEILDEINHKVPFLTKLNENLRNLLDYSFSEILNNAIEHSQSKYIDPEILVDSKNVHFTVSDLGIGVFRNVMIKRNLGSEFESMQDLLKGKTTTQPHAHSGEGIFFTSKVADVFVLESSGYSLRVDNTLPDVFFEQVKPIKKGTRVHFTLSKNTKRHLTDIFSRYETDHDDPDFDKTEIHIRLFKIGTVYVSRSQARRVLTGLDKFKHIILNFEEVSTIGQAFADEIYRIFQQKHPDILITSTNMNEAVKYMIDRTEKPISNIK